MKYSKTWTLKQENDFADLPTEVWWLKMAGLTGIPMGLSIIN